MSFISPDNRYTLDFVDYKNDLLAVWNELGQHLTFKFKGWFRFFKDGNGVGETWTDYDHCVSLEHVPVLSDSSIFNHNFIIELLANKEFKKQLKENSE